MTEKEARAYHGKKIEDPKLAREIASALPPDMHITRYDKTVRYKVGHHPKSKAQLRPEDFHFRPGESGNAGRKHPRKRLQEAYQNVLDSITTHPDGRKAARPSHELLAEMHLTAMKETFKSKNWGTFSRILADFRTTAGEIPTQESHITQKNIDLDAFESLSEEQKIELATQYLRNLARDEKNGQN